MTNLEMCNKDMKVAEQAWKNEQTAMDYLAWLDAEWTGWHPREKVLQHTAIFDLVEKQDPGTIGFNPVGINSPDWVTAIVEKDGQFLCVKQLRYGLMRIFEELPCGMVEKGEDPKIAAQRELAEETGYNVELDDIQFLGKFSPNPAFMSNYMHYFYVKLHDGNFKTQSQNLDAHEKIEWYWKDKRAFVEDFEKSYGSCCMGTGLWLLQKGGLL